MEEKIKLIDSLDLFEKLRFYMEYYISMVALKYNFEVVDKSRFDKVNKDLKWNHGYGLPDKDFKGMAFYFLCKDLPIKTFEEFISKENIRIIDNGNDWKENGFAQKVRTDYFGIYKWIENHKINLATL